MNGHIFVILQLLGISTVICAPIHPDSQNGPPPAKKPKPDLPPKCRVLISEIQLGNANDLDALPFIELSSVCAKRKGPTPKFALSSYKLIIVKSVPLSLVMVVDMQIFPYDGQNQYVVIGSPRVPNVDISLSTPHAQSTFSQVDDRTMLPLVTQGPYAVILLRDLSKTEAKDFHLFLTRSGSMKPRPLTADQIKLIQSKAVDMVVLGQNDEVAKNQFSQFWRNYLTETTEMFYSSWENVGKPDQGSSLSMCSTNYDGFSQEAFRVSFQSPGSPNHCGLEADEVTDLAISCPEQTSTQQKPIHVVTTEGHQEIKGYEFKEEWIKSCERHFPLREKPLDNLPIRDWIHFESEPHLCRFYCAACKAYHGHGFRPDVKKKPNIVTPGFLSNDIYDNNAAIKKHLENKVHVDAMQFFQGLRTAETNEAVAKVTTACEEREKVVFNATMNIVSMGYTVAKTASSFESYVSFMKTLVRMGVNVGWWHHTSVGAHKIATVISNLFRVTYLTHLVEGQEPFSIMGDSSTSHNQPYLAIFILSLLNGVPVTQFYGLIHMANGEKAKQMVDSLTDQIEADDLLVPGFSDYFKQKLVSIVTDGAAVMVGVKESFTVHLMKYAGRPISNIVCLAHKLDSSYKLGIKENKDVVERLDPKSATDSVKLWQLTYFESFEKSTNDFYTFYQSYGHKKWMHLQVTAAEIGVEPKRIKYVHQIRWSDSHYQALETLHHNYYAMVEDVSQLRTVKGYDDTTHQKASELYDRMTDKTFMVVLHEFLDILSTFKKASKLFQQASSLVAGKVSIVYEAIKAMELYRNIPVPWLEDFLQQTVCVHIGNGVRFFCDEGDCTLEMYAACPEVSIKGVKLKHNSPVIIPYPGLRTHLYDNMIKSLKKYFNLPLLDAFEVFNPQRLNPAQPAPASHDRLRIDNLYVTEVSYVNHQPYRSYQDRVVYICSFYHMSSETCGRFQAEWMSVLYCLLESDQINANSVDSPNQFWPIALTQCASVWTPLTIAIVSSALVTPYSSAECERGFSIMNYIKTKGRSRLDKITLDSLMRVKINGPPVENFYSYKYTAEFLKSHKRADDTKPDSDGADEEHDVCDNSVYRGIY